MGIGDEYVLPENYNEAYGLMADGVCVPAVRFLAQHVLEPVVRAQRDAAKPIAAQWADDQRRRENPWMRIVSRRP
jgi:DNA (cytosine-5)-methyltransferase 1